MNLDILKKLQAPFKPDEIEWRVGSTTKDKSKGMALAYVTNRAIQNRLDDVFGVFGWQNKYREWGGKGQLCGIAVKDPDTGEWVEKWDGADNTSFEPTKGGLSDAMKRAAYQWGIGRYLYKLDATWVPIKQVSEKVFIIEPRNIPKLPIWALPEGVNDDKPAPHNKPEPEKEPYKVYACKECGADFEPFELKGKKFSAADAYNMAIERRGEAICKSCHDAKGETLPFE